MRRYKPGSDDDAGISTERLAEAHDLDVALRAMGC